MWTCVDLSLLTGNDGNGLCGGCGVIVGVGGAPTPTANVAMNILCVFPPPPQHRLPSGDAGLRLQELRQLQDAAEEAEGGAEGERVLHAAPAAGVAPGATDAAEAGERGGGG